MSCLSQVLCLLSFSCLSQILCLLSCLSSLVLSCHVLLYCIVLLIFVYFYCKHTFIFLQGVLCIFFHISIICFDIFFPFSHFSALFGLEKWFKIVDSYLIIQDVMVWCLIMYEWSRVYIFVVVEEAPKRRTLSTWWPLFIILWVKVFIFYFILRFSTVFTFLLWFVS